LTFTNISSVIGSLDSDDLITVPILNLLGHFNKQLIRDRTSADFIDLLSGNNDRIPIVFRMNGSIVLDKPTLFLFFIYMYSQHLASDNYVSGPQRISQLKQEPSREYEEAFKKKLEESGYR